MVRGSTDGHQGNQGGLFSRLSLPVLLVSGLSLLSLTLLGLGLLDVNRQNNIKNRVSTKIDLPITNYVRQSIQLPPETEADNGSRQMTASAAQAQSTPTPPAGVSDGGPRDITLPKVKTKPITEEKPGQPASVPTEGAPVGPDGGQATKAATDQEALARAAAAESTAGQADGASPLRTPVTAATTAAPGPAPAATGTSSAAIAPVTSSPGTKTEPTASPPAAASVESSQAPPVTAASSSPEADSKAPTSTTTVKVAPPRIVPTAPVKTTDTPQATAPEAAVKTTAEKPGGSMDPTAVQNQNEPEGSGKPGEPEIPRPIWQTVDNNWDDVQVDRSGNEPEKVATGGAWKQLEVGETDRGRIAVAKDPSKSSAKKTPVETVAQPAVAPPKIIKKSSRTASPQKAAVSRKKRSVRPVRKKPAAPAINLAIINESGQPEQTENYRFVLKAMGYSVRTLRNRIPQPGPTTILYGRGLKNRARLLAQQIPGHPAVAPSTTLSSNEIVILIR